MSYQVLARKWRPQTFDDVVGQEHVTKALRNAIRSDRVPHALLLTGPRGVGKTTLARILARCLNCDRGPTDAPCGECPSCREISSGHSIDVQEIDAASRTGVDDVRELIEAIRYAPSPGKTKIFVVDEVHMLSTPAFNALLKTLEEPPPRSLFVFATTNPEKIPFTVISRCQRHDLRRIGAAEIVDRLRLIAQDESIAISEASLLAVAREADGSLRDAETLLDQLIAYGGGTIDDAQVAQVLDLIDRRLLLAIARACIDGDPAEALAAYQRAASGGSDAKRLAESLVQLLRDLVALRLAPERSDLVDGSDAELDELRELIAGADLLRLRRMFRALMQELEDLAWAPRPHAVVEMALVRLATLAPGDDVARLLGRLDALEQRLASEGLPGPRGGGSGAPPRGAAAPPESTPAPTSGSRREPREPRPAPTRRADPLPPDPTPAQRFERLRQAVAAAEPRLAAALEGGSMLESAAGRLRLALPSRFALERLQSRRERLEEIGAELFGERVALELVELVPDGEPEPSRPDPAAEREFHRRALDHPAVVQAREILDGTIAEIRPSAGSTR